MTGYDAWKLTAPEDEEQEFCEHCTKPPERCRCGEPERDDDDLPELYDGQ